MIADTKTVRFFVPGFPVGGGSKKAFTYKCRHTGNMRASVTDDTGDRGKQWRSDVKTIAAAEWDGRDLLDGPLFIRFIFQLQRPKSHYGTGRNAGVLKDSAPRHHTQTPDVLKLARAAEDALTGILWVDDKQIVDEHLKKAWHSRLATPGMLVEVEAL